MNLFQSVLLRVDFWIYVVMAVLFISGIFLCLLPVRRVQKSLKNAAGRLSEQREDGSFLYDAPAFLGCDLIDDAWARFLRNLELMKKNNAACEVTDFINAQSAIHEPGHSAYGEAIPGLLTTLGILGSFYGIVRGLSFLDLSTTVTMSESIAVLISGMRTAFNTSIVGAVLALTFQIVRRAVIGSAQGSLRIFIRECQAHTGALLTPDATLMQTLHAILTELEEVRKTIVTEQAEALAAEAVRK